MATSFSSGGSRPPPLQSTTTNVFLSTPTILRFLGWDDARLLPSDWSLVDNPFWTTFLFSLILFPCLFYGTWYLNPSLAKNRLGLSWVLGFYSALFFTIAGFYEVPHLRTIFNAKMDYQPSVSTTATLTRTDLDLELTVAAGAIAAAKKICYPILKAAALALLPNLPSFMRMDPSTPAKYYCFSDLEPFQDVSSTATVTRVSTTTTTAAGAGTGTSDTSNRFGKLGSFFLDGTNFSRLQQQQHEQEHEIGHRSLVQYGHPISPQRELYYQKTKAATKKHFQPTLSTAHKDQQQKHHLVQQQWYPEAHHQQQQQQHHHPHHHLDHHHQQQEQQEQQPSLRHRIFQGQMQRPHLLFSLENYPDDARIGPHIIAANFQAFLVVDLILGAIHYRRQLEPFSTVIHHFIYFFIVVHMRAGDMLSVFCICGTPIEASSIFLAYGRMFPHLRTPIIERLYVACFVTTRLGYVSLLWHEIYYNYPDKSVTFLYTITISLHVYWFVLYIKTQRRFAAKKRRQQLCTVLNAMAHALKEEFVASVVESAEISNVVGGGMAEVEEQKGGEAHVKGHGRGEHAEELDPLLNQSSRKKRNEVKEEDDLLLPLPDTNVRLRRRSSPQV